MNNNEQASQEQQPNAPPPRKSQGADLADLLRGVNYDPHQRGARYRGPTLSDTQDIDLTALLQVPLPEDDALDLNRLTQSLCTLPLSTLLGIHPEYLHAAGLQDDPGRKSASVGDAASGVGGAPADVPQAAPPPPTPQPVDDSTHDAELEALLAGMSVGAPGQQQQQQGTPPAASTAAEVEEWLDSL